MKLLSLKSHGKKNNEGRLGKGYVNKCSHNPVVAKIGLGALENDMQTPTHLMKTTLQMKLNRNVLKYATTTKFLDIPSS